MYLPKLKNLLKLNRSTGAKSLKNAALMVVMIITTPVHSAPAEWTEFGKIKYYHSYTYLNRLYVQFDVPNAINPFGCASPHVMTLTVDTSNPLVDLHVSQIVTAAETGSEIRFQINGSACGVNSSYTLIRGVQSRYLYLD